MDTQRADYEAARDEAMGLLREAHLTGDELRALMDAATVRVSEGPLSRALAPFASGGTVHAVDWPRMCDLLALRLMVRDQRQLERQLREQWDGERA